jgi:hypothetical protein
MASQRDISMVDVDAAEDDQRQYGHDPMSEEELSKKYLISKITRPALTITGIQIDHTITQRHSRFISCTLRYLIN